MAQSQWQIEQWNALLSEATEMGNAGQTSEAVARYDRLIQEAGDPTNPEHRLQLALAMFYKAQTLKNADAEGGDTALDEFQRRFGNPPETAFYQVKSTYLFNSAMQLLNAQRHEDGIAVVDQLVAECGQSTDPFVRERLVMAIYNKGTAFRFRGQTDRAVEAFDEAMRRFADAPEGASRVTLAKCGYNKGIALRDAGLREAAIEAFGLMAQRFLAMPEPQIQERVAASLLEKSKLLAGLSQNHEALAALDELILKFENAPNGAGRGEAATAFHNKAELLLSMGQTEDGLAAFETAISRYGNDASDEIQKTVLLALCNRAHALRDSGRLEEAFQSYGEALARVGSDPAPELRTIAGSAWMNLGVAATKAGRLEDALLAFAAATEVLEDPRGPAAREVVARAVFNKGAVLSNTGHAEEANRAFEEVVSRFAADETSAIRELVESARTHATATANRAAANRQVLALYRVGGALLAQGEAEKAATVFDEVIAFGSESGQDIARKTATAAWHDKGRALAALGRRQEALDAFNHALERISGDSSEYGRAVAAEALVEKASVLRDSEDTEQALVVYDRAIETLGEASEPFLCSSLANALLNKGVALVKLERPHEAIAEFDRVIQLTPKPQDANERVIAAKALYNRAAVFIKERFREEAEQALRDVIARFGDNQEPEIRELVAKSRDFLDRPFYGINIVTSDASAALIQDVLAERKAAGQEDIAHSIIEITPAAFEGGQGREGVAGGPARHIATDPFERDVIAFLEMMYRREAVWPSVVAVAGGALFALGLIPLPRSRWGKAMVGIGAAAYSMFWARKIKRARMVRNHLEFQKTMAQRQAAEAAELHQQAMRIVAECRQQGRPFGLFLRNFDLEAYEQTHRASLRKEAARERLRFNLSNQGKVESRLAAALRERLPLVGIANPTVHRMDYKHTIPKLALPFDGWKEALDRLVSEASLIVMDLDRLSAGVSTELETILRRNKQDRTVVILSDATREAESQPVVRSILSYFGSQALTHQPLEKGSPQLAPFPRVVHERDVSFYKLGSSPLFADLLPAAPAAKGATS